MLLLYLLIIFFHWEQMTRLLQWREGTFTSTWKTKLKIQNLIYKRKDLEHTTLWYVQYGTFVHQKNVQLTYFQSVLFINFTICSTHINIQKEYITYIFSWRKKWWQLNRIQSAATHHNTYVAHIIKCTWR